MNSKFFIALGLITLFASSGKVIAEEKHEQRFVEMFQKYCINPLPQIDNIKKIADTNQWQMIKLAPVTGKFEAALLDESDNTKDKDAFASQVRDTQKSWVFREAGSGYIINVSAVNRNNAFMDQCSLFDINVNGAAVAKLLSSELKLSAAKQLQVEGGNADVWETEIGNNHSRIVLIYSGVSSGATIFINMKKEK